MRRKFTLKEKEINWKYHDFHPVVNLPEDYLVLDLNKSSWKSPSDRFCIGKYNEVRPNMYNTELFEGVRNIHMGIDIGGPVGTPCMAFSDGVISHFGYNSEPGDYGFVVITKHVLSGKNCWALYGHLDSASIKGKKVGEKIEPEKAAEMMLKHRKSLPNTRQQGGPFGATPRGRRFAPPPWGSCCLPFGKDFLCFGLISGAHPEAFPPSFFWDCPPSLVFP